MRHIQNLSPETIRLLWRIYRQSTHHQVRQRAHCILLSNQGMTIAQLMSIFQVTRKTIYNWFLAWETHHLVGLYDASGRGRKPTFTEEQKHQIRLWAKETPKNLNLVLKRIQQTWNIKTSKETLKRVLKSLSMSWHRLRRLTAKTPDPIEYQLKRLALAQIQKQAEAGEIDLRFCDESGFSLVPYVPYAWQDKGESICLMSEKSKPINVFGLMNRDNDLDAYIFEESITSEVVIACIDDFCHRCALPTIIVMDQASIHVSHKIQDKLEDWKRHQVEIFWLPPYSPHLNLIEILWRFAKYEWIEFDAYESKEKLAQYVEKVLKGFGNEYVIDFA